MRYSILFVIALIVASGFIAYFGDILGRRMGKRRLTLFHMRPKYTAIAVTTVTGMIISALVLAMLVTANSQFKKVLTEGEQILAQNDNLKKANTTLFNDNHSLLRRSKQLRLEVAQHKKDVLVARAEAKRALQERETAIKAIAGLKNEIAARKVELALRLREYDALRTKNAAAESELKQTSIQLQQVRASLKNTETRLANAEAKAAEANLKTQRAIDRLNDAEEQTKQAVARLAAAQEELRTTGAQLESKKAELIAKQKTIEAQLSELELLTPIAMERGELRSGNVILKQGEELARASISASQPSFGIKADLFSLLDAASDKAGKMGAAPTTSGRTVSLLFRKSLITGGSVVVEDDKACVERAADAISRSGSDAMVQVVCATNTMAGEHIPAELMVFENKLVYRKGDLIATSEMDGRGSEGRVLLSVIDFLQSDVASAALTKGTIPMPNYDPRTSQTADRQRQLDGLMTVVDQIKSKRARVTVDVYACADIRAGDPLNMDNLRFSVRKGK